MDADAGRLSSSGFVLLDCPQSMKIESNTTSLLGALSDYFLSLSNRWNVSSYLKSLPKVMKGIKLGSCLYTNQKEGSVCIVCPFPHPSAVLRTMIESSVALGNIVWPVPFSDFSDTAVDVLEPPRRRSKTSLISLSTKKEQRCCQFNKKWWTTIIHDMMVAALVITTLVSGVLASFLLKAREIDFAHEKTSLESHDTNGELRVLSCVYGVRHPRVSESVVEEDTREARSEQMETRA